MSNNKLTVLGIVAVVMVIWAVVQSRVSSGPPVAVNRITYLIQGLDTDDIGSIIIGTGDKAVILKRQGGRFVVVNKDDYPAKTSEVNSLISDCLGIQTSEFVTDNPENQDALEVTEQKARMVIKFMTPEPNSVLLAGIAVGKTKEVGQGTYVRLLSSDSSMNSNVYISQNIPWFSDQPNNYIEQELVSVKRDDIESVTVSSPDGKYVLKPVPDSQDVVLENLPVGKKLKSSEAKSVFSALSSLRFEDVTKNSSDLEFNRQYVCRLKNSTEYTLNIAVKDDKTYLTCSATFTEGRPGKSNTVETEDELKAKEAKLLADDKAREFTAAHQGWVYEIADWKAKNLKMPLSDLVEDESQPQETNVAEGTNEAESMQKPAQMNTGQVLPDANVPDSNSTK